MLSTIGYEGACPEDFLNTLRLAKVDVVIDVRDRAQSRRPGFSKSALAKSLGDAGIRYIHLRELGDPKEGRDAARANDLRTFRLIFSRVLETSAAQDALEQIIVEIKDASVCLLCYERNPDHCHRTLIADKISERTGQRARKLGVRPIEPANKPR